MRRSALSLQSTQLPFELAQFADSFCDVPDVLVEKAVHLATVRLGRVPEALALFGGATMWMSVFADLGAALLVRDQ